MSNNVSNETDGSGWPVFVAYWELMICLVGTPLNLLVVFVWWTLAARPSPKRRHAQTRNRWFILSMTCGDLLFTCVHAPLFFAWYGNLVEMGDGLCLLVYGTTHLSTTVSSISLLLLNVDKFVYLHWPLHYWSMMTKRRALAMTACGWLVAFTWAVLFLFGSFIERGEHCSLAIKQRLFYALFLVVFFLTPILLSTATSFYIAAVAARARLAEEIVQRVVTTAAGPASVDGESDSALRPSEGSSGRGAVNVRAEIANTAAVMPWRTITYVFTTTIWCTLTYLPYRISLFVSTFTEQGGEWKLLLFAIMVTYAAGNPIITIVTQPTYRRRVAEIFRLGGSKEADANYYAGS